MKKSGPAIRGARAAAGGFDRFRLQKSLQHGTPRTRRGRDRVRRPPGRGGAPETRALERDAEPAPTRERTRGQIANIAAKRSAKQINVLQKNHRARTLCGAACYHLYHVALDAPPAPARPALVAVAAAFPRCRLYTPLRLLTESNLGVSAYKRPRGLHHEFSHHT